MAPRKRKASYSMPRNVRKSKYTSRQRARRTPGKLSLFQDARKNELKFHDRNVANGTITSSMSLLLSPNDLIAAGTADDERIGSQVILKSLQIKGVVTRVTTDTTVAAMNGQYTGEIYVILDTQCNGAQAAAGDVFASSGLVGRIRLNMDNRDRFKVIHHSKWSKSASAIVNNAGGDMGVFESFDIDIYKKMNLPLQYTSGTTTGGITTLTDNNLLVFVGVDNVTDATTELDCMSRVRYTD